MARIAAKTQWTHEDEAAFLEMSERRQRVLEERRRALDTAIMRVVKDDTNNQGEVCIDFGRLCDRLAVHADGIRDALAPFDSGVRAADEPPAVS